MKKWRRSSVRRRSPIWIIIVLAVGLFVLASTRPVAAQTVTLTPNVGTQGTLIQVSGSGFESDAVKFVVTCGTAAAHLSVDCVDTLKNDTICSTLGSGNCVGTFRVDQSAVAGVYVISVYVGTMAGGDGVSSTTATSTSTTPAGGTSTFISTVTNCFTNCGPAYAQFVLGAPSAQISLSPTVGGAGTTVVVSGNGFSVQDTGCKISTGTASIDTALFNTATPPCSMSVGNAGGSFVVKISPAAPPGLYLISVFGIGTTDFASNFFEVPSTTGTTLTPTTVTTSTSTTSVSVTQTVNATSTSVSTTSISSTGATTETSFTLTTQTYFAGPATTTTTTTILTTSTTSLPFTILTTTTLFTTSVIGGIINQLRYSTSSNLGDFVGVISVLGLLGPILLRRFLA